MQDVPERASPRICKIPVEGSLSGHSLLRTIADYGALERLPRRQRTLGSGARSEGQAENLCGHIVRG
jgi:hypothetical protein